MKQAPWVVEKDLLWEVTPLQISYRPHKELTASEGWSRASSLSPPGPTKAEETWREKEMDKRGKVDKWKGTEPALVFPSLASP